MSGRRTNKHRSSKDKLGIVTRDGEPFIPVDRAKYLLNQLIDTEPTADLERGLRMIEAMNKHCGINRKVTLCSCCAKKIGLMKCTGCLRSVDIRYCSKECQLADWPAHKALCGSPCVERDVQVIDVE
jgi:hypothetical protein